MEWERLRDELDEAVGRVAGLLRAAPGPEAPVPGLEWDVGTLGAHLVTIPQRYLALVAGDPVEWPGEMAPFNERLIAELGERDPEKLAALLEQGHTALMEAAGEDGARPIRWFFDVDMDIATLGAIGLGELVVHGLDLARAVGQRWEITRDQAATALLGLAPVLPHFLNEDVAGGLTATFHVRLRGVDDMTFALRDGALTIERGRTARPDVVISADPVAYLLVGYGRASQWPAILTGRLAAWGRKPWLAFRFANLFQRP